MLAVRRQRHQELATAHTTHDATERRVTELYTKAVEQLGNSQAPVRLGGLYALERLAQDTPALRQTIVDVICSYLRMPYTPPREDRREKIRAAQRAARMPGATRPGPSAERDPQEERQVRLTAQRILTAHLCYDRSPTPRRWWPTRRRDRNPRHWKNTHLDLAGAVLIDIDLNRCRIGAANFAGATFSGNAGFAGATFSVGANFAGATFSGAAWFDGATFSGAAWFDEATFSGGPYFNGATLTGDVGFGEVAGLEWAVLEGVRVAPAAAGARRVWPPAWRVETGVHGWQTLRLAAGPAHDQTDQTDEAEQNGPGQDGPAPDQTDEPTGDGSAPVPDPGPGELT
ncbi:pentapeptide repeat-containing protein [Streptosporangiaceae bacterium NEAU-GS5]|nr:pentapeptide repeat-containing protein [Streptosporangiaceae bacterium NEAU-GS5]